MGEFTVVVATNRLVVSCYPLNSVYLCCAPGCVTGKLSALRPRRTLGPPSFHQAKKKHLPSSPLPPISVVMAGLFKISVLTALAASITSVVATPPACLLACVAQVQKQLDCLGLNDLKCICSLEQLAIKLCLDKQCPNGDADAAKQQLGSTCNGIDESSSSSSLASESASELTSESASASASQLASAEQSASAEPTESSSAEPTSASAEGSAQGSAEPTSASAEGSQEGQQGGVVTETIPCEKCHESSHEAAPTTQESAVPTTQQTQHAEQSSEQTVAAVPTVSIEGGAAKVGAAGAAMVIAGLALL